MVHGLTLDETLMTVVVLASGRVGVQSQQDNICDVLNISAYCYTRSRSVA